jgi:hypothetical protein
MTTNNKAQGKWYVSFETPRDEKRKFARVTETFASEHAAKQFAKDKLVHAHNITAGTLNPVRPKRIVAAMQVPEWIEGPD